MSYEGIVDPDSAAALASVAADAASGAMVRAVASATTAAAAADAAAASQAAISALLATSGIQHRWTGTVLQLQLPDGSYGSGVDLKGDKGDTGETPVLTVRSVRTGAADVDIDSSDPLNPRVDFTVPQGPAGPSGWTPVLALVADGTRLVMQITGWSGGSGVAPAIGAYLGSHGYVAGIADAVDLKPTLTATDVGAVPNTIPGLTTLVAKLPTVQPTQSGVLWINGGLLALS